MRVSSVLFLVTLALCSVYSLDIAPESEIHSNGIIGTVECKMCTVVISGVEKLVGKNHTVDNILHAFHSICKWIPGSLGRKCVSLMELFTRDDDLLPMLLAREEYTPAHLCTIVSACQEPCCTTSTPEQVHIALAGDGITSMNVMWVTKDVSDSLVFYGLDSKLSNTEAGTSSTYTFGGWSGYIHSVTLNNLKGNSKYFYKAGGDKSGFSQIFSFRTQPDRNVTRFAVIGDMGVDPEAENNINLLTNLVKTEAIDVIVHSGDISYADGYQHRWDQYFRRVQDMVANIPYMTCPGNHEIMYVNMLGVFGYKHRFTMPSASSDSTDPLYYSWNYGAVHFIGMNSESSYNVASMPEEQVAWLRRDLIRASLNRERQPWIVVYMHRPLYCSNDDVDNCEVQAKVLREAMEALFLKYKVDLVVTAHKHDYERTTPLYNNTVQAVGKAPVYVVNGAGGNREGTTGFSAEKPAWSAFQISKWGYATIEASKQKFVWTFKTSSDNQPVDNFVLTR